MEASSSKSLDVESEIQARRAQEEIARIEEEKENVVRTVEYALKETGQFEVTKECVVARSGSRMQKYWLVVKPVTSLTQDEGEKEEEPNVATIAPLPQHCPLLEEDRQGERVMRKETMKTLNGLVGKLQTHPYLHCLSNMNIHEEWPTYMYYLDDRKQVVMVQAKSRSLKDIIHNVDKWKLTDAVYKVLAILTYLPMKCVPLTVVYHYCNKSVQAVWVCFAAACSYISWCCLKNRNPYPVYRRLHAEKVARYGRQVLEAMTFLYKQGFPVLGHVQSGNIFVHTVCDEEGKPVLDKEGKPKEICRLGGYENTLLGYRSRFYRMCKDHLEHIDVIMFGHLVFEMSCGYELTTLKPTEKDYKAVKHEEVKELLHFIFPDSGFPSIDKILSLDFFQSVELSELSEFDENKIKLTDDMKDLLARVRGKDGSEQFSDSKHKRRRRNKCRVS